MSFFGMGNMGYKAQTDRQTDSHTDNHAKFQLSNLMGNKRSIDESVSQGFCFFIFFTHTQSAKKIYLMCPFSIM